MWVAEDMEWVCSRYLVFWIGVFYSELEALGQANGFWNDLSSTMYGMLVPDMIGSTADVSYHTLSVCSMINMALTDVRILIVYTFIRHRREWVESENLLSIA